MKLKLLAASLAVISGQALAGYPVTVLSSVPITSQVVPALTSIETTLAEILTTNTEIGSAITQASDKNTAVLSEGFQAQRSADNSGVRRTGWRRPATASPSRTASAASPPPGSPSR